MKKYLLLLLSICVLFVACEKENSLNQEEDDNDETTDTEVHDDTSDYVWDANAIVTIALNGSAIIANGTGVTVNGSTATIASAGVYSISGTLTNGQIVVNTTDENKVVLIMNGASISNTSNAPVYVEKAKKVVINLAAGTQNSLTDAASYVYASGTDEPNAALYSKAYMTIFGEGALSVKGSYKDGITSKDGLIIAGGNITVNAADDGIRGKDYLIVKSGTLNITSTGDGIKSDNETNTALGYVDIKTGTIKVTAGGDAIAAKTNLIITSGEFDLTSGGGSSKTIASTLSAKAIKGGTSIKIEGGTFTINSADDAVHTNGTMEINGGNLALSSGDDGLKAETSVSLSNATINITKSYEGIESPSITVNSGNVSIVASDDAFNATKGSGGENNDGSMLTINGGTIYASPTTGDGLDSNGSITINGGTVIVQGPQSQPEVGMDYNGTCNVTGGFVIISGPSSNMFQGASTSSTQYSLKLTMTSSVSSSSLFHIQDASGTDLVTFKPARTSICFVFSSPSLKSGGTYYVYTGGTHSGTLANGVYTGGSYTPGTQYTSFTISSIVTSLGSSTTGPFGPR